MAGSSKKRLALTDYTVAIICPLEVEMSAMRYMLDEEHVRLPRVEGDQNSYVFGAISGHNVVLGFLPHGDQGIGAAAIVATHMKRTFPFIHLRLLVGLAGGIPSYTNDIRLGDVVISMPTGVHSGVVQYDLGKETTNGFERKGTLEPVPREWRDAVVLMMSDHRTGDSQMLKYIDEMIDRFPQLGSYKYPARSEDRLFVSEYTHQANQSNCDDCDTKRLITRTSRNCVGPAVFTGLIASGDRVIKNGEIRDKISKEAGGALCFEMEAAGLMNDFRCLVVRGICDYADSHKNDEWHACAAGVAAACVKEILTYVQPNTARLIHYEASVGTRYFMVPNQTLKDFVGREEELKQIQACFSPVDDHRIRIIIIHALGGQGKSQLALECCYRLRNQYRGVFWINSSSIAAATQSLSEIALEMDGVGALQGRDEDTRVQFVLSKLSQWKDRWLMVYDNCDDPSAFASIRRLIPNVGKGDILLTSRHRGLEPLGTLMQLLPLPSPAGVALLLSGYNGIDYRDHLEIGTQITDRLGGLSLAIKQAAAYIQYRELPIANLGTFIDLYESHRDVILQHTPDALWEYGTLNGRQDIREKAINAFTTWEMSLQILCPDGPECQKTVLHVLTLAAFLAPVPVHESLFQNYLTAVEVLPDWACSLFDAHDDGFSEKNESTSEARVSTRPRSAPNSRCWSHEKFWNIVRAAKNHCLIQGTIRDLQPGAIQFSLHPLIRDWLQLRDKHGQSNFVTEAYTMLSFSIRAPEQTNGRMWNKQSLLAHVNALMELDNKYSKSGERLGEKWDGLATANSVASFYEQLGHMKTTLELRERMYSLCLRRLGPGDSRTQLYTDYLVLALRQNRLFDRAIELLRKNVACRTLTLGSTHPDTIFSTVTMVETLVIRSELQPELVREAEEVIQGLLALDYEVFGMYDLTRLYTMSRLGNLLARQKKDDEAEAIYRKLCHLSSEAQQLQQVDTIRFLDQFIHVLLRRGKIEEGTRWTHKAMMLRKEMYADDHPDRWESHLTMALILEKQEEYEAAEKLLELILNVYRELGLEDHLQRSLRVLLHLATILDHQQKHHAASEIMKKALVMCCKTFASPVAEVKGTAGQLAFRLYNAGVDEHAMPKILLETLRSGGMLDNDETHALIDGAMHPIRKIFIAIEQIQEMPADSYRARRHGLRRVWWKLVERLVARGDDQGHSHPLATA